MFKIGDTTIAHADAKLTAVPDRGKNAGQAFTFGACKSIECDANVEATLLMGTSYEPIAIVAGNMKPDFKIGLDVWEQMADYAEFCGPGHIAFHHTLSVVYSTFTPRGKKVKSVTLKDAVIQKGWGFKSEAGGAPSTDISGLARVYLINSTPATPVLGSGSSGFSIGLSASIGGLSLGVSLGI
jgi:hypothetical protein